MRETSELVWPIEIQLDGYSGMSAPVDTERTAPVLGLA